MRKCSPSFGRKAGGTVRGRQRTDSTHVLGKIRALNRVLCVWETMRAAPGSLAVVDPDWLRAHSHPEWVERYGPRSEDSRSPLGEAERLAFVEEIGQQGRELLDALFEPTARKSAPPGSGDRNLGARVWVQNYQRIDEAVRWRSSEDIPPPSRYIGSPYERSGSLQQEAEHHLGWLEGSLDRKL